MDIWQQILGIILAKKKAKRMTNKDIGKATGISGSAVGQILAGNPRASSMQRITDALGITIQCTEAGLVARDKGET